MGPQTMVTSLGSPFWQGLPGPLAWYYQMGRGENISSLSCLVVVSVSWKALISTKRFLRKVGILEFPELFLKDCTEAVMSYLVMFQINKTISF